MGRMGDLMIDRMNSEREAAVEWLSKRHGYGKKGPHTYPATPEKPPFGPTPDLKVGRGALDEAKKKPKGKKPPMKATPDKEEDDLEVSSRSEDVPPRKKKTAMMKWLAKHQGPGPHKSGSSQDVHAGAKIMGHLKKHGKSSLMDLQMAAGYPRSKYGNIPDTNPANAFLLDASKRGEIIATRPQFGDPLFSTKITHRK